jgi:hypothetical protein
MNDFDFDEKPAKRPGAQVTIWDFFSVLVLLATVAIGAYFVYVFIFPTSPLNPLQAQIPTPFLFPTGTITPIQPPPTWTPTFIDVTDTPTLAPTITLQPTATGFSLVPPSATPSVTSTPKAAYNVNVTAISSTIIHPDTGCAWFGVGGTVVDANNAPMLYFTLRLVGTLNGNPINKITVSGTKLDYGQSGFEFLLPIPPVASDKLLTLQLLDQSGLPLAQNVYLVTYNDCKKNLILVRFKKNP